MQSTPEPISPGGPPPYTPPTTPPKPRSNKAKIFGFGCGLPILALIGLSLIGGESKKSDTAQAGNAKTGSASTDDSAAKALVAYSGKWQGQDGTSLWIRDGKGDFDGGNVKVQGGGVSLENGGKTLKISSFFGIGKEWTIDQAPHSANSTTEMTLNKMVYRRTAGFTPGQASEDGSSQTAIPAEKELRKLVAATILDFDAAVKKRDFTKFHDNISQAWREQTTPQDLKTAFATFIKINANFSGAATMTPKFSPAPRLDENGHLQLKGFYASGANRLNFDLGYISENDNWKLLSIALNFKKGNTQ